jgi:hypothetical protein
MRSLFKLLVLSIPVFVAFDARADVLTFGTAMDNTLYENGIGELSNGQGPTMFTGRSFQGVDEIRRAVLKFDVSSIPAGSTVTAVTLRLYMGQTISLPQTTTLHLVSSCWGEGTSIAGVPGGPGGASAANDATWIHRFFPGTLWANPGGDFSALPSASLAVGSVGFYTWGSTAGMVADVQAWVNAPASNHGWLVRGNETQSGTAKRFDTKESLTRANRPSLSVEFTPPVIPVMETTWGRIKTLLQ